MNERFKDLEKQCWSHRVDGTLVDGQLHFDTQKFAELIVRECIDIAGEEDFDVMMKEGYPCSQTAKKIREHFGVEE